MKTCCYTCIVNGYDVLHPIPEGNDDIDFICFTDDLTMNPLGWKLRPIPSDIKSLDKIKQQRMVKILPNKYLSEYDVSVWIDGNIAPLGNIRKDLLNHLDLESQPIYMRKHPSRNCVYQEKKAVLSLKKASPVIVEKQIKSYMADGYPKNNGMVESNVIVRAHNNQKCCVLMYKWACQIVRWSHRDQLSFNYVSWKYKIGYGTMDVDLIGGNVFGICKHGTTTLLRGKTVEHRITNSGAMDFIYKPDRSVISGTNDLPVVTVAMMTHNRTRIACAVIESLVRNIVYPNLKWCISDDRSDQGHVEALVECFRKNGVEDVNVCKSTSTRYGLGASMNQALDYAFGQSDFILTTEDDWILEKELDLSGMVRMMMTDSTIAMIRLAAINRAERKQSDHPGFDEIYGLKSNVSLMNMQVALRHRRLYSLCGKYRENCSTDTCEMTMEKQYNRLTDNGRTGNCKILIPSFIPSHVLDDPSLMFIHVGVSTVGHGEYSIPSRYRYLYETETSTKFHIVIPSFNVSNLISRAIRSIKDQTYGNYTVTIVDDCSTDDTVNVVSNLIAGDSRFKVISLDSHHDGGGARNVGIESDTGSDYTMFMDADDYFYSKSVLSNIAWKIEDSHHPDAIKLAFRRKQQNKESNVLFGGTSINDILLHEAPWTVCVKTSILPKFVSHRRAFNDVVWYYRMADAIKTFAVLNTPCIVYTTCDNKLSCQHSKTDIRKVAAIYYLIADLMEEQFRKPEVRAKVRHIICDKMKALNNHGMYMRELQGWIPEK